MTWALWVVTRAALLAAVWLFDADDDITELAFGWASDVLHGRSPWHDVAVAYPPLAMFGFAVPGLAADSPDSYALPFALSMLCLDAVGARFGGLRYVLTVPALGPVLLLWRYDLAPALCHLGALTAAIKGRRSWSWAWLGVGIALKPYLLVVVPLWWMWDRSPRALLVGAPSVCAAVVATLLFGFEWVDSYAFQGSRELSVEAGPAVVASVFGVGSVGLDRACLCFVRADAPGFALAGTALCLPALLWIYWRRPGLVAGSIAAIAALLLFAPVFSPQYLVWLVVPATLLGGRALWLATAAAFTGFVAYPLLYDEVLAGTADPLLALRLLLLAALIAIGNSTRGGEKRVAEDLTAHDERSLSSFRPGGAAAGSGGRVADATGRAVSGSGGRGDAPPRTGVARRLRPR